MFNTQHREYADPIVQWKGEQEKASLHLGIVQRENSLVRLGKNCHDKGEACKVRDERVQGYRQWS